MLLIAGALACDRKKPDGESQPQQGGPQSPATSTPVAPEERESPEAVAALPVEEDFEGQVTRQIRADNLEAELDKIERELLSAQ